MCFALYDSFSGSNFVILNLGAHPLVIALKRGILFLTAKIEPVIHHISDCLLFCSIPNVT